MTCSAFSDRTVGLTLQTNNAVPAFTQFLKADRNPSSAEVSADRLRRTKRARLHVSILSAWGPRPRDG